MKAFAVLHLEKAKGNDSAISAHIERTVSPKNADVSRFHLNKEYIRFPENIKNRSEAIQYRIKTAQLSRKVSHNQVRAIRIILSGSHEQMLKLESDKKIDEWVQENIKWLNQTFGKDNLVSLVLHLDEKTPHLHGTVVPIVSGERRKSEIEKNNLKKKYKCKDSNRNRLCADDLMNRQKLKFYQDSYAINMEKFGLSRGLEGSTARHVTTSQYYTTLYKENEILETANRELVQKAQLLHENIQILQKEENIEKAKEHISNFFTGNKTKKLTKEIMELQKYNEKLKFEIGNQKEGFEKTAGNLKNEQSRIKKIHEIEVEKLNQKIKSLDSILNSLIIIDPLIIDKFNIMRDCRDFGLDNRKISKLFKENVLEVIKNTVDSNSSLNPIKLQLLKTSDNKLNVYVGEKTLLQLNNEIKALTEEKKLKINPAQLNKNLSP